MNLIAASMIESPVIDMSAQGYAKSIRMWLDLTCSLGKCSPMVDLAELDAAVSRFARAPELFDSHAETLRSDSAQCSTSCVAGRTKAVHRVNKGYIALEREFYYEGGMDGYNSLHHVLFAPAAWHSVAFPMPGLDRSLRTGNWENAKVSTTDLLLLSC